MELRPVFFPTAKVAFRGTEESAEQRRARLQRAEIDRMTARVTDELSGRSLAPDRFAIAPSTSVPKVLTDAVKADIVARFDNGAKFGPHKVILAGLEGILKMASLDEVRESPQYNNLQQRGLSAKEIETIWTEAPLQEVS